MAEPGVPHMYRISGSTVGDSVEHRCALLSLAGLLIRTHAAVLPTLIVCAFLLTSAALLVLSAGIAVLGAVHVAPAAWAAYLVMGIGAGGWNVLSAANRQRLTPTAMMGRVTSAYRTLAWGLMPLGAGLAGPAATVGSLGAVILGAAVLIAVIALLAAPRLREL